MTNIVNVELFTGKQHVFLATPSYDGKVGMAYTVSLAQSIAALKDAGIGVTYCLMGGNCHVDDARNGLVREFMMSSCTDLVFLDADIGWLGEDLVKLISYDRDMIAGVYPKKMPEGEEYPVTMLPDTPIFADQEGLVEAEGVPTGFLRIRRKVIEIMMEVHGQRKYAGQNAKPGDMPYTILFERTYEGGKRWSGDYAFCHKWKEAGGKIFVDPRFLFVHEGAKEWAGCLGDYWMRIHGVAEQIKGQKFKRALVAIERDDYTPEHLQDLVDGWDNEWSGQTELLETCIHLGRNAKGPILECGSGLTTLVLAAVSNHPVIALESSPVWGSYTERMLAKYGLDADIRCAPLKDFGAFEWYQTGELPEIGLVVCDGPPRSTKGGRNGLTVVMEKIKNAVIVLDDPAEDTKEAIRAVHPRHIQFNTVGEIKPIAISAEAV